MDSTLKGFLVAIIVIVVILAITGMMAKKKRSTVVSTPTDTSMPESNTEACMVTNSTLKDGSPCTTCSYGVVGPMSGIIHNGICIPNPR